jgi:hypothetical protein
MSEAHQTLEALNAARGNAEAAASAAGMLHRRGGRDTLPQHIADLADLVDAMEAIKATSSCLAIVARNCASRVRARYVDGHTPAGGAWPEPLKQAAADTDRALSKLCQHLGRTPVHVSYDALSILHGFLDDVKRDLNRTPTH